jgi:diguanylate cyclase (GGDEF)-like protein
MLTPEAELALPGEKESRCKRKDCHDLQVYQANHLTKLVQENAKLEHLVGELSLEKSSLEVAYSQMAKIAGMDSLTQLPNRRSLNLRLEEEWSIAFRQDDVISMLMIDVDHFKKYNDDHGHPAGDTVLVEVASVFRQSLKRPRDFVARYGGEEFAIVLPRTNLNGATCIAQTIRTAVFDRIWDDFDSRPQTTISIGVASVRPRLGGSIKGWIDTADRMLYQAKKSGRNQVQTAFYKCDTK